MPIYQNTGTGWHRVERWSYASEDELERFLLQYPNFIVGESDDVWTVWARQIGARSDNQLDLMGLSSDGSITIVECKLGSNREERREVVAQVLEYASALWKMDVGRFREIFSKQHAERRDPFELLAMQAPADARAAEWSVDQTLRIAALNLEHGRFRLVVAVDEVSERLRQIVDYVNSRGRGELKLIAVAIPRYGGQDAGVVAPVVYGDDAPAPTKRSEAEVLPSVDEVIAQADPAMMPVVQRLHEFLAGDGVSPGRLIPKTGKQSIGYDARFPNGRQATLFRIWMRTGKKTDPPASQLAVHGLPLAGTGTTAGALVAAAEARGFVRSGDGVRLRPEDLPRISELLTVIEESVLSRIDA
jgi:hypothetical protein